jgi:peptidoglycan-N-acetylglucosamine deacetylase
VRQQPSGSPARTVALTFDDGPGPHTLEVVDVLRAYGVRATFFVTGEHVAASPDVAAQVVAAGHVLANHSYTHPQDVPGSHPRGHFDELPDEVQAAQIDETTARIVAAAGEPPLFFRAPGGHHFGKRTGALVAARGMSVAHWTADTGDWNAPGAPSSRFQDRMVEVARAAAAAGDGGEPQMLLMHDAKASAEPESELPSYRGNTVAALPRIIEAFRQSHYAFADPAGHVW